ncbi:heterokaryon incompatibility protein-domain-containing protein [Podospora aff. communis PSN243]|uniref:Heterokaryon incompatibility protein-domain-containing protein n=1 Tax=Podospora aff. communis PSN243 TaxID=3040156 RepID=A0AAV9GEA0_9PEZI|nr:heterokaryon incompatibility protein-domain-containing protein [Podospora aff. communis PSN243]
MSQNPNERISSLLYTSLPTAGGNGPYIRLISVALDVDAAEIQCRLDVAPLAEVTSCQYFALSYVWGDASDTEIIKVNGHDFHATKNLVAALRQLRVSHSHETGALWVDAICINQADISERSSQVKMMDQIYKNATEVLCWLGEEDEVSTVAMRLVNALCQDIHESSDMSANEGEQPGLAPLKDPFYLDNIRKLPQESILSLSVFSQRPYWTRIWTLQEMVLAGSCKLICGSRSCYLQHIEDVVDWVHHPTVEALILAGEPPVGIPAKVWSFVTWIYRNSQVSLPVMEVWVMRRTLAAQAQNYHSAHQTTLNFLSFARVREATDIRDKLYGLSGICDIGVDIDYATEPRTLFSRFAAQMFSKASDIVYLLKNAGVSHVSAIPSLPTWVPDWVHHGHTAQGRFKANEGSPLSAQAVNVKEDQLCVFGVQLDTIKETLPAYTITTHEDEFQDVARIMEFLLQHNARAILDCMLPGSPEDYPHGTGVTMLQAVLTLFLTDVDLRTRRKLDFSHHEPLPPLIKCLLSALPPSDSMVEWWDNDDRLSDNTTAHHPANTMTQVLSSRRDEIISTQKLLQDARACYDEQVFVDFMRYNPFSTMTRPFRTQTGYIGCASSMAKPGDAVCVLGSCSMPVIFRRVESEYEFVSVAHVVGALYGEVWVDLMGGRTEVQEFCLR